MLREVKNWQSAWLVSPGETEWRRSSAPTSDSRGAFVPEELRSIVETAPKQRPCAVREHPHATGLPLHE